MRQGDSERAAVASAHRLDRSRLGAHFHDRDRAVGTAVAEMLGGRGKVAWDIYLFYPPGIRWEAAPPAPAAWFHQLDESSWADEHHHRSGRRLTDALRREAARLASIEPLH